MGSLKLSLHLDNGSKIFYPGQTISGRVTLVNEMSVKMKGITITFYGETEVYWTESEARRDTVSPHRNSQPRNQLMRHVHREYRDHETFLCEEILLFGQTEAEGGTDTVISPGIYAYPFTFQLPNKCFPSSFIGSPFGFVKYTAEATLKRPLFRYDKIEQEFYVNGILDLNFIPNAFQPFATNIREDFGWLCCSEGYAAIELSLEKVGFLPSENMDFTLSILNFSKTIVQHVRATFARVTEFRTFDRTKRTVETLKSVHFTGSVGRGGVEKWNGSFVVPNPILPTNLAGCRMIGVNYMIVVNADMSESPVDLTAPVIIGTDLCPPPAPPAVLSQVSNDLNLSVPSIPPDSRKVKERLQKISGEGKEEQFEKNIKTEYRPSLNPFHEDDSDDGLITLDTDSINRTSFDGPTPIMPQNPISDDYDGLQNGLL